MPKLTVDQYNSLRDMANTYGRTWKSRLRQMWIDGDYEGRHDSNILQTIRNTFGPSWLVRFAFKPKYYKPFNM